MGNKSKIRNNTTALAKDTGSAVPISLYVIKPHQLCKSSQNIGVPYA